MSRKVLGSSLQGSKVELGIAGQGEKIGIGQFLLAVVGGSVLVIVEKGMWAKKRGVKGRGIKGLMGDQMW